MAHPQSSNRGFKAMGRLDVGAMSITANSTGMSIAGAIFVNGKTTVGKVTANSTALVLPATGFQMAALSSFKITSNSTGVKIGARYISSNTTGNSNT